MKKVRRPVKQLYHLSSENHNGEMFYPRVPQCVFMSLMYGEYDEDIRKKRICFSTGICGAFRAIKQDNGYCKMYVHVPENMNEIIQKQKLYKPSVKEVFDCKQTRELWVRCPVKMKCIACISIGCSPFGKDEKIKFKYLWKDKDYKG